MCIFFVYALVNVVSHYYLSVLFMSVMGLQKKKSFYRGVVLVLSNFFGHFWNLVNFAKLLS